MGTKINHVAIVSDRYAMVAQFYQAFFGFRSPSEQRNFNSATIGDGYVGININPRMPARPAGLDHFGVEVDDVEPVLERLKKGYPQVRSLQRMGNRPFAGITTHDPDGNIFDLSQRNMKNRGEIYKEAESGWVSSSAVTHYAVRTLNPEKSAQFYVEILDLTLANKKPDDPNYYVTDGRMTLVLMPWSISDYAGTGIVRAGPNHIGIRVNNLEHLKARTQFVDNIALRPTPVSYGPEGEALRQLLEKSVPYATFQMADNDNTLLAVYQP
jgi:catechol 2,3-dioxygenase-like lactoylglutathione lyase family enzyme